MKIHTGITSNTYICVELPNEAGEIVVLEIPRQKGHSKSVGIPDHEAITREAPGDHLIGYWVIDHVEGLRKERRRPNFVQPLHRPWRLHKRIFYVIGTRLRVLLFHYIGKRIHDCSQNRSNNSKMRF